MTTTTQHVDLDDLARQVADEHGTGPDVGVRYAEALLELALAGDAYVGRYLIHLAADQCARQVAWRLGRQ